MNKSRIWKLAIFGLAATLTLSLPALAQNADRDNTLVVAIDADPAPLEPGTNRATPLGSEVIINVFDTLVGWQSPNFDKLEPRLATAWKVSANGLTYTFTIRSGVKFHDGTDLNAAAVKASIERTKKINPYMAAYFGPITSITTPDPNTVVMTLERASSVFLSWLAMPQAAIVSPTAAEKFGDKFSVNPVGTGAFIFESYSPDTVVLKANPNYWRGAPKVARLVYRVIPNASTRRLELEKGTVDIVQQNGQLFSIPVEDIKALRNNRNIKIIERESQIIRNIDFNNLNLRGPLADVRVRQAIGYAINYDGLVNGVLGGTAARVFGPLTSNSWGFNPKVKELAFNYDPNKAKALLKEAGVAPGSLNLKMYTFTGTSWRDIGTFLQANLADVGINLTLEQPEFAQLREIHTKGNFDIALDGRQPWYNDPEAHITIGYLSSLAGTALNFRMPANAELDNLILKAQTDSKLADRKASYFKIQELLMAKVPGIYLFNPKIIVYHRVNVGNLVINTAPPLTEYYRVVKIRY